MIKPLTKSGNSYGLVLSKEMREHLGLGDDLRVNVEFVAGHLVLSAPVRKMSLEESFEDTMSRYGDLLKRLED